MQELFNPHFQKEQLPVGALMFFWWENRFQPVKFVETEQIVKGVERDAYSFIGDSTKDLGIIRIQPGFKTRRQRIRQGERTIEGHISGTGKLIIERVNGEKEVYKFDDKRKNKPEITVNIDDIMQWLTAPDSPLIAYEICFPPYKEGRYEELGQSDLQ
jgi:hypothetical protein